MRRGRNRATLLGRLLAHDDVALLERGAQAGEVVLGQLMLVGEDLQLLLLDEAALGGLLEQALGRGEVMQMNRLVQWSPFPSCRAAEGCGPVDCRCAVVVTATIRLAVPIYRTPEPPRPFLGIANLRFPNSFLAAANPDCNPGSYGEERVFSA
jgi:hypothetical protein